MKKIIIVLFIFFTSLFLMSCSINIYNSNTSQKPEEEKTFTIYFYNTEWKSIYCYAWIDSETSVKLTDDLPGEAMNRLDPFHHMYSVTLIAKTSENINVIFSNGKDFSNACLLDLEKPYHTFVSNNDVSGYATEELAIEAFNLWLDSPHALEIAKIKAIEELNDYIEEKGVNYDVTNDIIEINSAKSVLDINIALSNAKAYVDSLKKRDRLVFYVCGDAAEVACYEKIAADYEKKHGFKVEVVACTGAYYDNLNILFSSKNNAPDIFFTESSEFASHLASRKIMNLQPYIESGKLSVKTSADADGNIELWDVNDTYRYDGNRIGQGDYYALIKDWSPNFVLWYNKAHIDEYNAEHNLNPGDSGYMNYPSSEVPMTWDEFLDMSHKLTKQNRYGTMLDRVPYKHLMEWIQMTGASTWDSENKYFNAEDNGVKKAFKFFTDLQVGSKASAPVIGPSGVGSGEAFANGNISFAFFGNWAYSTYNWANVGFEIGYAPSPVPAKADGSALTKDDIYAGNYDSTALSIFKDTTNPERAVDFLNYYMTYGNLYMATKGFNIPGNKVVAESKSFTENEDQFLAEINQYFLDIANSYTHPIVYNDYMSQVTFEDIVGKYLSIYLANPSGESLTDVLRKIADDVKKEVQ